MRRREHRLDRREAGRRRRQALAGPQRADVVHRLGHALDRGVRLVRDAHLLEPQREPRADAQHDPAGQDLVQGGARHGEHHRVAGERVGGAERHAEARLVAVVVRGDRLRDRRREADAVALEVGVVDPDGVEALVARPAGPARHLVDVATGGEAEADGAGEHAHGGAAPGGWRAWNRASILARPNRYLLPPTSTLLGPIAHATMRAMQLDDRFEDLVASLGGFYRTWYVAIGLELGLLAQLRGRRGHRA